MAAPNPRSRSSGEVLDYGFKLFQASFKKAFLLAVGTTLCYAPFSRIGQWLVSRPAVSGPQLAGMLLGSFVLLALALTFTGAVIARIDGVATGRELSFVQALAAGAQRAPAQAGAGIWYVAAVAAGLLLLLIPGIVLTVSLVFGPVAAVVERLGPIASLRFSRRIVRGHWWHTSTVLTMIGIIAAVPYVIQLVVSIAASADLAQLAGGGGPWYVDFVLSPLLSGIAAPLVSSLMLATLYDLKARHDSAV
jgi:hypothetical protein